jgi:pyruvate formate lyase activating enzyme
VSNEKILDNLRYLFGRNADVIIRPPMIPKLNDTDEDIRLLCEFLKENEGKYRYAEIMPYHTFGTAKAERLGEESKYKATDATSDDKENWVRRFADHGVNVKVSQ